MECPKYFYFRVKPNQHGTAIEIEDASDVDVVEVVRCKDCKHHESYPEHGYIWCNKYWLEKPEDWFCADGGEE